MKKKFIILTLCFTLIFTSINYNKSYADGGVISLPILSVVVGLAVSTGIALNDYSDIYDIGKLFYDKYKGQWDNIKTVFNASVALNKATNKVSVGNSFLSYVKDFFDTTFKDYDDFTTKIDIPVDGFPFYPSYISIPVDSIFSFDKYVISHKIASPTHYSKQGLLEIYYNNVLLSSLDTNLKNNSSEYVFLREGDSSNYILGYYRKKIDGLINFNAYGTLCYFNKADITINSNSLPYVPGSYDWDKFKDKLNENGVGIYVPGNLGDMVGGNVSPGDIVGDVAPPWVGSGNVSIPDIENPSIDVDLDSSFPLVDSDSPTIPDVENPSIPSDDLFLKVKEFIISLVVPNDLFWVDTFNNFKLNFGNAFPVIDMSKFNDLVVSGKPFPNIDINILGVKGRVVNGDVINSIVDWLRPIVAGFMMLCLMFFNYRKIYKLIRNTEPFGGIAPGTSDFRTGISEYNAQDNAYEIAQAKIRDTMFDIRNEFLSNKNKEGK